MSMDKKYIRHGSGAVRPYLYGNPDLPDFVKRVFGAVELERIPMEDGFHIEARIDDSILVLETGEFPPDFAPTCASVYVYVEDIDEAYHRALEFGAKSISEPEDKPYDERSAGVQDSLGNVWWISTYRRG
ncbi:MAG: VOC family protein [Blastocatellia bacterium]|nr:VOC family protein [Blastocatellia bacterium]